MPGIGQGGSGNAAYQTGQEPFPFSGGATFYLIMPGSQVGCANFSKKVSGLRSAACICEQLDLDIHDLLHVRSFLDHNRPYIRPANGVKGNRTGRSTGAFAHLGEEIPPDELEENLVRHLRRWAPYIGRFGLLILELHTLPPELTAANLDKTPAVAYDGTHGFSDQYLIELPIFLDCAREAGLQADPRYQAKFPPSDLATVSLNFFTSV